jgi:hypothetical protein
MGRVTVLDHDSWAIWRRVSVRSSLSEVMAISQSWYGRWDPSDGSHESWESRTRDKLQNVSRLTKGADSLQKGNSWAERVSEKGSLAASEPTMDFTRLATLIQSSFHRRQRIFPLHHLPQGTCLMNSDGWQMHVMSPDALREIRYRTDSIYFFQSLILWPLTSIERWMKFAPSPSGSTKSKPVWPYPIALFNHHRAIYSEEYSRWRKRCRSPFAHWVWKMFLTSFLTDSICVENAIICHVRSER